ncbi:hypothetical protein MYU51_008657 [Penicillium brevicompactum]
MSGDGIFTYRDGISVAQIVIFSTPLLLAVYFKCTGRIGWFCIGIFSLLRLIGASCKLAAINSHARGLSAAIFVCESLGMILIMFLLLELLERTNKYMAIIRKRIFLIPSIITWIDIGISIGGWVAVMHVQNAYLPTPWSQASTALLAVIYLYLVGVFVAFWLRRKDYPETERWGITGVAVCIPLLAVRLAYSLIFIITSDMKFNAIKGNATAYLVMTMLPEALIIAICTWIIFDKVPLLSADGKQPARKSGDEESQENRLLER